ncbi:hypothetical protein EVAR_15775_1 [Eumeta japonica]|uniref:Uncharacterized protein n=1 Tax=Eumeta variegata TaxID=151549 RepID=A0A4C1TZJ9_EUMVA|nr:hypothetical protein EVAR_15775_1 [Eumeta japonica]
MRWNWKHVVALETPTAPSALIGHGVAEPKNGQTPTTRPSEAGYRKRSEPRLAVESKSGQEVEMNRHRSPHVWKMKEFFLCPRRRSRERNAKITSGTGRNSKHSVELNFALAVNYKESQ